LSHGLPTELGQLQQLEWLDVHFNVPGISGSIPSALGQLSKAELIDISNNALDGLLSPFLQPLSESQNLFIGGNPYYCPLPLWSIAQYSFQLRNASHAPVGENEIYCLHCPSDRDANGALQEAYKLDDGTPDYTSTCSGHGTCVAGLQCSCDPAWSGFTDDCSLLACPVELEEAVDGAARSNYCNGRADCLNQVFMLNGTSALGAEEETGAISGTGTAQCHGGDASTVHPADFVGDQWVAYDVDCGLQRLTVAYCDCPVGTTQPYCGDVILAAAQVTVLSAAFPLIRGGGLAHISFLLALTGSIYTWWTSAAHYVQSLEERTHARLSI